MENASKALLMAASVLVGVLLISIGVYLFTVFGNSGAEFADKITQSQISKFNAQFTKYEDNETCRIHDIISVANLAKSNNAEYDADSIGVYYIKVEITNISKEGKNLENLTTEKANELLQKYALKDTDDGKKEPQYFKCTEVNVNSLTKRVDSIKFEKID